jgi:hypothetical protein
MKKLIIPLILFVFVVNSCYYDNEEGLFPKLPDLSGQGICDTTHVTYSLTIKPMLTGYCTGCHGSGANTVLTSYSDVSGKAQKIYKSIMHQSGALAMPQGLAQLDACTLKQFKIWMDAGMPNN